MNGRKQLNRLMKMEDQNYYLGDTNVKWSKEESVITPIRKSITISSPISVIKNEKICF